MQYVKFRKLTPNTICAPPRGRPPVAPEGYEQDVTDPFLYHIKMPPCEHREERIFKRPCCDVLRIWCTYIDTPVERFGCANRCPKKVDECKQQS